MPSSRYETGFDGRDRAEPVDLDQVARHVHRRDEQEDEEDREEALHRLARAGPQRGEARRARRSRATTSSAKTSRTSDAERARLEAHADREADREVDDRLDEPERDARRRAGRRAARARRIGVSASRLRKPVWMSRARSVPAFIVANSAPWMNGTASAKARKECVGKPGSFVAALQPAGVDGEQQQREDERRDRRSPAGAASARPSAARARTTWSATALTRSRRLHRELAAWRLAPSSPAPSSERPVFARKTSSSDGWCSCEVLDLEALGVERADDRRRGRRRRRAAGPRRRSAPSRTARRSARAPPRRARARPGRPGPPRPSAGRSPP